MVDKQTIKCPDCPYNMILIESGKHKYPNGKPKLFYQCVCGCKHQAHPNGQPVGVPADKETRNWRHKAHIVIEKWGSIFGIRKRMRYIIISRLLKIPIKETHIGQFNSEICKKLINILNNEITGSG